MAIIRVNPDEVDHQQVVADLRAARRRTEEEIEAEAAEDGDAWTDEQIACAVVVFPPPTPQELRDLRSRLGLSQAQFATRYGFSVDTVQQYEQGRRIPSGPAATLLRVIAAEPEAVARALSQGRRLSVLRPLPAG